MPAPAPPSKGQRTISSFFASSSSAKKKRRDDDGVDGVDDGPVVIDGDDENVAPKRVKTDARASSETPTTVEARVGGDETARGPAPARSVEETLAALEPHWWLRFVGKASDHGDRAIYHGFSRRHFSREPG